MPDIEVREGEGQSEGQVWDQASRGGHPWGGKLGGAGEGSEFSLDYGVWGACGTSWARHPGGIARRQGKGAPAGMKQGPGKPL